MLNFNEQVSSLVQFHPLSLHNQKTNRDLLLETKFDNVEDAKLAVHLGVTHKDVAHKAIVAKDNCEGKPTHVQMTMIRMPNMEGFAAAAQTLW